MFRMPEREREKKEKQKRVRWGSFRVLGFRVLTCKGCIFVCGGRRGLCLIFSSLGLPPFPSRFRVWGLGFRV